MQQSLKQTRESFYHKTRDEKRCDVRLRRSLVGHDGECQELADESAIVELSSRQDRIPLHLEDLRDNSVSKNWQNKNGDFMAIKPVFLTRQYSVWPPTFYLHSN
jgi:hypothetical protein